MVLEKNSFIEDSDLTTPLEGSIDFSIDQNSKDIEATQKAINDWEILWNDMTREKLLLEEYKNRQEEIKKLQSDIETWKTRRELEDLKEVELWLSDQSKFKNYQWESQTRIDEVSSENRREINSIVESDLKKLENNPYLKLIPFWNKIVQKALNLKN